MQKALADEGSKSQERALEMVAANHQAAKDEMAAKKEEERRYVSGAKRRWREKVARRAGWRDGGY